MTITIRHLIIHGRVQGVGFRAWVVEAARQKRLAGWVRNRRDGTVEAVFAGPSQEVGAAVAVCRSGPPHAHVANIVEREAGESDLLVGGGSEIFVSLPTV
ncbi:MAG: acylphosphatase [Xanthobacteraceae bacterium]|nr:acylphosphatase [Xanthobacteraceae bacterium]